MKNLIIIAHLLVGCSTVTLIPGESAYYGVDFRPYTSSGFLITPEKFEGEYESIGIVQYVFVPGANLRSKYGQSHDGQVHEIGKEWIVDRVQLKQGVTVCTSKQKQWELMLS